MGFQNLIFASHLDGQSYLRLFAHSTLHSIGNLTIKDCFNSNLHKYYIKYE